MAIEKQEASLEIEEVESLTILRSVVGSTVHGLDTSGTSDLDELGICCEPPEFVIGLRTFEQFTYRSKPKGARSESGDLDLTIYGLRKFCSLALKGNPSVLVLFFVPEETCSVFTNLALELRDLSWAFASKRAGSAFLGYMQQQRQRLMGERGQMNVKRPELIERYGYDVKYASHIVRLGFQGIDYMNTGSFPIPMPKDQRDYIFGVKQGRLPENDVLSFAGTLEQDLKEAIEATLLPDAPDYAAVNDFLIHSYQQSWRTSDRDEL